MANTPVDPEIERINDPAYGGTSRPIDIPNTISPTGVQQNTILPEGNKIVDKSAEYAGQSKAYGSMAAGEGMRQFGDLFAGIAAGADFLGKVGDALIKKDIENQVYDISNKERLQYTEALEALKQKPGGTNNLLDANAQMPDGEEVPNEVEEIGQTFGAMKSARDAGKVSNTYYYARLTAAAKDLRARHPGYRDYIDKQFAQVTGVNPANAYISALVRDLNASSSKANSESNFKRNFIMQNLQTPGMQKVMRDWETSGVEPTLTQLTEMTAPYEQQKAYFALEAAKLSNLEGNRKLHVQRSTQNAEALVGAHISNSLQNTLIENNADTPEKILRLTEQAKAGIIPQEQFRAWGTGLTQMRNRVYRDLMTQGREGGKNSIVAVIGSEEYTKIVNKQLSIFDDAIKGLENKDFSGMHSAANWIKSRTDETARGILQNPKIGPYVLQAAALEKAGGTEFAKNLNLATIRDGVSSEYKSYFDGFKREFHSQVVSSTTGGPPVTFNDALDEAKVRGFNTDPALNNTILKQVDSIIDKNTPDKIKENVAAAAFSPGNYNMIRRLTENKQAFHFSNWTSAAMTEEMARLGKTNRTTWTNYKNWAENEFSTNLFPRELNDLNKLVKENGIRVAWSPTRKEIVVESTKPKGFSDSEGGAASGGANVGSAGEKRIREVQATVNRLNMGISSMGRIAKAEGGDVETYVLRVMRDSGVNIKDLTGAPAQIVNSLVGSRNGTPGQVSNFTNNDGSSPTPSVADFQANPISGRIPVAPEDRVKAPARRSLNLTAPGNTTEVLDTIDIPPGMDPNEFIKQLRNQRR